MKYGKSVRWRYRIRTRMVKMGDEICRVLFFFVES